MGRELREKLWALAERRPADPGKLLGQAFAGKKSLGEIASAPQTSEPGRNAKISAVSEGFSCVSRCRRLVFETF